MTWLVHLSTSPKCATGPPSFKKAYQAFSLKLVTADEATCTSFEGYPDESQVTIAVIQGHVSPWKIIACVWNIASFLGFLTRRIRMFPWLLNMDKESSDQRREPVPSNSVFLACSAVGWQSCSHYPGKSVPWAGATWNKCMPGGVWSGCLMATSEHLRRWPLFLALLHGPESRRDYWVLLGALVKTDMGCQSSVQMLYPIRSFSLILTRLYLRWSQCTEGSSLAYLLHKYFRRPEFVNKTRI